MKLVILLIIMLSLLAGQVNVHMFADDGSVRIDFCYAACWVDDHNSVDYSGDGWAMFGNGYVRWAGCVIPAWGCS